MRFCPSLLVHKPSVSVQGMLENEYVGTSFAVGQVRSLSGFQALQNVYDISVESNGKWENLLILFVMAIGYRLLVFVLLQFLVRKAMVFRCFSRCSKNANNPR